MTTQNAQLLAQALAPKSDQLNADDLITGKKIIVITGVKVDLSSEQKTVISYQGDNGKPWKPSKGMGRVLAHVIGGDPDLWIGHAVELYRDESVSFGQLKNCGGIRISALSAIKVRTVLSITTSRNKKTNITIEPLVMPSAQQSPQQQAPNPSREWATKLKAAAQYGSLAVDEIWSQVPQELKDDKLTSWYGDQFKAGRAVDIQNEPPADYE